MHFTFSHLLRETIGGKLLQGASINRHRSFFSSKFYISDVGLNSSPSLPFSDSPTIVHRAVCTAEIREGVSPAKDILLASLDIFDKLIP